MTTMTGNCLLFSGWRFAREDRVENSGTIRKEVQNGNGCKYHGNPAGRQHPSYMSCCFGKIVCVKVHVPFKGTPTSSAVPLSAIHIPVRETVVLSFVASSSKCRRIVGSKRRYRSLPIWRPNPYFNSYLLTDHTFRRYELYQKQCINQSVHHFDAATHNVF